MKLLDSKGRIFGLINIIDLIVLVLVVALVLGGAYRFYPRQGGGFLDPQGDQVLVMGRVFDVSEHTVKAIRKGDRVIDPTSQGYFGEVIDVQVAPNRKAVDTADGRVVMADVPERFDVILFIKGTAQISENNIRMTSHDVRVGSRIVLGSRDYMIVTTILQVDILD